MLGIVSLGGNRFAFEAAGSPVAFPGVTNPMAISLFFGNDSGTTSVKALIARSDLSGGCRSAAIAPYPTPAIPERAMPAPFLRQLRGLDVDPGLG